MTINKSRNWLLPFLCIFIFVSSPSLADTENSPDASAETPTEEVSKCAPEKEEETNLLKEINTAVFSVLFADVLFGSVAKKDAAGNPVYSVACDGTKTLQTVSFPLIIFVLLGGALFFTVWYQFINLRGFKHAVDVVRGKYDKEEDAGEISHFRALTSALSATVGLGNIAGVAVAIQIGGPGAVLWMIITAIFGMSSKFSSCTLSQMYRQKNEDGSISGGPMYYLDLGLKSLGIGAIGKILGIIYAIFVMAGAIGGGNMFQANQMVEAVTTTFHLPATNPDGSVTMVPWIIGIVMCILVGIVILGGIKRIGAATSRIVPLMCGLYVVASLVVIFSNIEKVPEALGLIVSMAFYDNAMLGGLIGVLVIGVQRAAFSNEAGLGSAAIAHAAAKTDEPVREGLVAMLGPFIDTIIVCLMTALVIVVTGAWADPSVASTTGNVGVSLTAHAFSTVIPWFPYVLTICICLFAYSTMISWCYYGERGWIYMFDHFGGIGLKSVVVYRVIFVLCIIVGAVNALSDVLDFADAMILSMAFPNIIGSIILAPKVLEKTRDYWDRYKAGKFG